MREPKFTKAPWTACFTTESNVPVSFHIAASPHGSCLPILECRWPWKTGKERTEELTANAHLVAAAPELYEALEGAEDILSILFRKSDESAQVLLRRVQSALAKARGEAIQSPSTSVQPLTEGGKE